ncbi:hypothetical protein BpHYR1_035967 [Brachionus plicatilis]|uniref:Uncharacterized protein n=1 Tax=Brachionus plicatilis TaxID=10195 RepID=A0A3M7QSI6_BRAPC|nr:hypothetical protein BpHYR1_035967 [Brachionus plicatilis]
MAILTICTHVRRLAAQRLISITVLSFIKQAFRVFFTIWHRIATIHSCLDTQIVRQLLQLLATQSKIGGHQITRRLVGSNRLQIISCHQTLQLNLLATGGCGGGGGVVLAFNSAVGLDAHLLATLGSDSLSFLQVLAASVSAVLASSP